MFYKLILLSFLSGAFLIPYLIMMILIGMPLLFMEYSFGQYFGVGSITIFNRVCPMFRGECLAAFSSSWVPQIMLFHTGLLLSWVHFDQQNSDYVLNVFGDILFNPRQEWHSCCLSWRKHKRKVNPSNAKAIYVQSTRTQDFIKPSKPCCVDIHWITLAEYCQMSSNVPGFHSFSSFICTILYWPN